MSAETKTVVIEETLPHPPEKVWRALTTSALLAEWLLPNDFEATESKTFTFRSPAYGKWDGIIHCEVLEVRPPRTLAYRWASMGLDTVVRFTLTASGSSTVLRMEQAGFLTPQLDFAYNGAQQGWKGFFQKLAGVLAKG